MKKISALCAAVLVIACFALPVFASEKSDKPLILTNEGLLTYGDTAATEKILGGGSYEFDSENAVLTLKNIDFTTSASTALDLSDFVGEKLTVIVVGENSFVSTYSGISVSYGINLPPSSDVRISGGGTITATAGTSQNSNSYGVYAAHGDIEIAVNLITNGGVSEKNNSYGLFSNNADIRVTGKLTATGGTAMTLRDSYPFTASYGVFTNGNGNIYVSGNGEVTVYGCADGETSLGDAIGIHGRNSIFVSENGKLNAFGGASSSDSVAIETNDGLILRGNAAVTATGGYVQGAVVFNDGYFFGKSIGINGVISMRDSASITATGGKGYNSYGIYSGYHPDRMRIDGGTVTATGGEAEKFSAGIGYSGYINVSGNATVNATGGSAGKSISSGLDAQGLNVSGKAKVYAVGGSSKNGSSVGIYVDGTLSVTQNGEVTGVGGASLYSGKEWRDPEAYLSYDAFGVYVGYKVEVSDRGLLTATGGKSARGLTYGLVGDNDTEKIQKGNGIIIDNGKTYKSNEYIEETPENFAVQIAAAFYDFIKYRRYYFMQQI
jgi:hypothetical protein